jgi:hypothetical protein
MIHGDHGSRLTQVDPQIFTIGRYTNDDLIAGFSTFFAVRPIDGKGRYVDEAQPITPLIEEFTKGGFKSAPNVDAARVKGVILDDHKWRPRVRVPMADGWVTPAMENAPAP